MIEFDASSIQHIAKTLAPLKSEAMTFSSVPPDVNYGEILVYKTSKVTYVFQSSERIDNIRTKSDKAIVGAVPGSVTMAVYRGLDLVLDKPFGTPSLFTIEHIMYPTAKLLAIYNRSTIV